MADSERSRWDAYLFQTTTGQIGPRISIAEGRYSISLNETEEITATIIKKDLNRNEIKRYFDPWYGGILFTFEGKAIAAGVITDIPKEYNNKIQIEAKGVREILSHRYLIQEMSDADFGVNLAKSVIRYNGVSLGTIAQNVVRYVCSYKPGSALPIRYPSRRESQTSTHLNERTYKGFNVNNLDVDSILTKLSNVRNGPDIMFRPTKVGDQLYWDMHHGTRDNYRIDQKSVPIWDLTVEGQADDIELTISGSSMADRVIAVGGGTDTGATMQVSTDDRRAALGFPFLEKTISSGNSDNANVVRSHAIASRQQNYDIKREFTFSAHAWDGASQWTLGNFFVGDLVKINTKGYWYVPDGINDYRLLNINGNFGSGMVSMALQLDSQWDNLSKKEEEEDSL